MSAVIRIKLNHYIWVLDGNTNVTRVVQGPLTFTRKEHESVVHGPERMVMVPVRHYVRIRNPVILDGDEAQQDEHGATQLRHGEEEIRLARDPFPLYPGEELVGSVTPLKVIEPQKAIRVRAVHDFTDGDGVARVAGDQWLIKGPGTYEPGVEVEEVSDVDSHVIKEGQALRLRALRDCVDQVDGKQRLVSEEWLVREPGAYLPGIDEEVVRVERAVVLTEKRALRLAAKAAFTDVYGVARRAGEEWLVTMAMAEAHIPDVYEDNKGIVNITSLSNRQFCVVVNPVDPSTGQLQHGHRELRKGETSFFLKPGETLERGIQEVIVLGAETTLLLRATAAFTDDDGVDHPAGDQWLIQGPREYIPPIQVQIVKRRRVIPLDEGEGIYVRNLDTGNVRTESGQSYKLRANEELWSKELPPVVEQLLVAGGSSNTKASASASGSSREKTKVVSFRAPYGSAVQVYNYKEKVSRIVFGPDLVSLQPEEQFTLLELSDGAPKKEGEVQTLALMMGPDFMTDVVEVETSDHAGLRLELAYSWRFDIDRSDPTSYAKIFNISDYVGFACRALASRIRAAVAATKFDEFHKSASDVIKLGVFGAKDDGSPRDILAFDTNNLVITTVDVQSVEPIDQRTVDALQKSVQQAIEITTKSQEDSHQHAALQAEQEAQARLQRQKLADEIEAEKTREELVVLRSQSETVKRIGEATSDAEAKQKAAQIQGAAEVEQAELKARAHRISEQAKLEELTAKQAAELEHQMALVDLELSKAEELAQIEARKFKEVVSAIGPSTIQAMAQAGPEAQAKLLEGLGLQGVLITDGKNPINLWDTATSMVSQVQHTQQLTSGDGAGKAATGVGGPHFIVDEDSYESY